MLDIKWIRENPDVLDGALAKRGAPAAAAELIALDEARRAAIQTLQDAQTRRNSASRDIGQAKAAKDDARAQALMAEVAGLKDVLKTGEEEEKALSAKLDDALARLPNVPQDDVPEGPDETANVAIRRWGTPREVESAKEHFELGEAMDLMDFEAAARMSGSRFVVLKGQLARMERALGQFMLDLHTEEHGYTEVQPPILVKDDALFGTAQLPKFAEDQFVVTTSMLVRLTELYRNRNMWLQVRSSGAASLANAEELAVSLPEFDTSKPARRNVANYEQVLREIESEINVLESRSKSVPASSWLIPTAEVPLTNLVREQILAEDELPLRFTALTPCFRSEAGSAGRDTRGMLRQHQFDKVELVSIITPEASRDEHERMTICAEEVLKRLDLAYRVMLLSTGDMGFASRKTYDLEVWLPGQKAFREISSCSTCGDFQARRMQARYRPEEGKQTQFVHTLNGSGTAVGRALIAVMETYQNSDGSITVPDALRPYMGGLERIGG